MSDIAIRVENLRKQTRSRLTEPTEGQAEIRGRDGDRTALATSCGGRG